MVYKDVQRCTVRISWCTHGYYPVPYDPVNKKLLFPLSHSIKAFFIPDTLWLCLIIPLVDLLSVTMLILIHCLEMTISVYRNDNYDIYWIYYDPFLDV